ncbi:MAG TPA: tetratricopeptide repeat protein [Bacteroidota bacterium]|nr:tetratricopeptide repeat protein [Bacteroidota bacterium]
MIPRAITAFLLFLISSSPGTGQTVDWGEVHRCTMRGIDRLYDLELEKAIATFDSVRIMAPGDPRGYFFGSMVHFWLYTLTREEKEYDEFLARSDEVIAVCERSLDQHPDDPLTRFYLGGIYGYRGLARYANNSIVKAITDGRRGYNELKDAVAQKPDLYDAQMGFGLFMYMVAKLPTSLSWILRFVGYSGDAEAGMNMLRNAAEHGLYTRTEARFYLSGFLFTAQKHQEALSLLDSLIAKYPDNTLFLLTYANWQSRLGNTDEGLHAAQKAMAIISGKSVHYGEEFAYSTLGGIYFIRNDFQEARKSFERFLHMVRSRDYISNMLYYRLGVSQEICGDRASAIETYKRLRDVSEKNQEGESHYHRLAVLRIRRPLSPMDIELIEAANELTRKEHAAAGARYAHVLAEGNADDDIRVQAIYGQIQITSEGGNDADALRLEGELVQLNPASEKWAIAQGYFKLGETLEKLGRRGEARSAYEHVLAIDDYDYQRGLEERARAEIRRLKEAPSDSARGPHSPAF